MNRLIAVLDRVDSLGAGVVGGRPATQEAAGRIDVIRSLCRSACTAVSINQEVCGGWRCH